MPSNQHSTIHFLKYILRHQPDAIEITIDRHGWVNLNQLINAVSNHVIELSLFAIYQAVRNDDQHELELSEDGFSIRLKPSNSRGNEHFQTLPQRPPHLLYHCVSLLEMALIRESELKPMTQKYLQLADNRITALISKSDANQVMILTINADRMHQDGYRFYPLQENLWLTERVPVQYITFP